MSESVTLPKGLRINSFGVASNIAQPFIAQFTILDMVHRIELFIVNEFEHSVARDNAEDALFALREALRALDAAK